MHAYQQDFVRFAVETGVLRFGDFALKSGRRSPYFFNAGRFDSGAGLARLGQFYAKTLHASGLAVDMLFGPAYKGIPLAAATAIAMADLYGRDLPYAFNRKEAKDHGEGGQIVGRPLQGRVLVIDDVITAGTSVGESVELIEAAGAELAGVLIALDRRERGQTGLAATDEVAARYGVEVLSIASLTELIDFVRKHQNYPGFTPELIQAMESYRQHYGVTDNGESP
ncbi:orotate phosphoribosyltransferase [Rhabdochromatium marinum]|uniref:orotate phosphoribosyltransferase n=1 Tax=Rhabdochromatium marinum TaxID=48729 RepID=UPI001902C3F8|nr:orotate phosphoribosyltransferase [Rhabdochromatium marinum]MBK1648697.1 orotate phosphoribosyltransferase [Rhabdochromatium marinum]